MKGQISTTQIIIGGIITLIGSIGTAFFTTNVRGAVIEERENNHYAEVIRRMDEQAELDREQNKEIQSLRGDVADLKAAFNIK